MLEQIAALTATLTCGLFAGAAIYINMAEHPARLECGTELAATVFGPSYRRAALMQASLALLATLAAGTAGLLSRAPEWWFGAAAIFSVVPFTFAAIMPTNKRLLDASLDRGSDEARALLIRWGRLHAVRSVLSLVAFGVFVAALL